MQKVALRYHRFSDKDQSNGSIERQTLITGSWCTNNNINIAGTFNDDGHSAKTFDRPDVKKLFEFIKSNKGVHYLIVAELTRFSRDLGEAVSMVKKIQAHYGIQIVSAGRNTIYDVTDPTSFTMMSLEFLFGHTENIKRENDINGGIYTAKKEGRYIASFAPFGYRKEGQGKNRQLVIVPEKARVIRYMFQAYLSDIPLKQIGIEARAMGFNRWGNSAITNVLTNFVYTARQEVKPWRQLPGGIFPGKWEPIIDMITFSRVQEKLNKKKRVGKRAYAATEALPLRGVLRCSCGRPVTGAASTGRHGGKFLYYKCNGGAHLNLSAKKAHAQLEEVFHYMSIPEQLMEAIAEEAAIELDREQKEAKNEIRSLKRQLIQAEADITSLEEKYIRNQIAPETYSRWFRELTNSRTHLKTQIDQLSVQNDELLYCLNNNLDGLSDLRELFRKASAADKQALITLGFDNQLTYSDGSYRTPYMLEIFQHNELILKQKKLLFLEQSVGNSGIIPSGGLTRNIIEPLTRLFQLAARIKAA